MMQNSGVLWIDSERWLPVEDEFFAFCRQRNWTGASTDQGLLLDFFGARVDQRPVRMQQLPDELNWKGYWGWPRDDHPSPARILHFHGPKPKRCLDEKVRSKAPCDAAYEGLFPSNTSHYGNEVAKRDDDLTLYAHMLALFEHYYDIAAHCSIITHPSNSTYRALARFVPASIYTCTPSDAAVVCNS
jgi:hypothetical protein